jgi:hypothetical protein
MLAKGTLCQLHKNGCQLDEMWCQLDEIQCWPIKVDVELMKCVVNQIENACITIFVNNYFYCYFFKLLWRKTWKYMVFFPVSKCLVSLSSKTCNFQKFKKFGGRFKKKTLLLKHMIGRCDRNPKTYGSFVFLDVGPSILFLDFSLVLGALVNIWWARFHQKHWSLKNKSKP